MKRKFATRYRVSSKHELLVLLILLFMLCCLPVSTSATETGTPTITVGNVNACPGDTVEVPISITGNPGIIGAKLTVTFGDGLTLTGAKSGEAFTPLQMTKPGAFTSPCSFTWDAMEITSEDVRDGTVLTLTFKVGDSVAAGTELPITVSYDEKGGIVVPDGQKLKPITANVTNGKIRVQSKQSTGTAEIITAFCYDGTAFCKINAVSDIEETTIVVATYTSGGQICGLTTEKIMLQKGVNSYELPCSTFGSSCKVFLMNGFCKPLSASKAAAPVAAVYTVTFADWDGKILSRQKICAGESAIAPEEPERSGYRFSGWSRSLTGINSDCTITAQYEEDTTPTFTVENVIAKPGDKSVTVNISVSHNPGILGMTLKLAYDDSVLTLKSAKNGSAVSDVLTLTKPKTFANGCSFIWDGVEVSQSDIQDGTILMLTFDIAGGAVEKEYPIGISFDKVVDNNLKAVNHRTINGCINVTC